MSSWVVRAVCASERSRPAAPGQADENSPVHMEQIAFISSERFTRGFVAAVTSVSSSPCYFETVSRERHNISAWVEANLHSTDLQNKSRRSAEESWLPIRPQENEHDVRLFAVEEHLLSYQFFCRAEPGVSQPDGFRENIESDCADDHQSFRSLTSGAVSHA
ncbi:hypothetical protein GGR56DRAFT_121933 [Xylariaceae sp. FL0804]|nr:hypothetical protein GGR56DRAFT_121933 [Xylariaceae sp. FL0804]